MGNTPVHVHMFRLLKHITETPLSLALPVSVNGNRQALVGRQRKIARRRRKTQQLLGNLHRGLKNKKGDS